MYLYLAFIGSTCCLTDKECTFLNQILNDKNHFKKNQSVFDDFRDVQLVYKLMKYCSWLTLNITFFQWQIKHVI